MIPVSSDPEGIANVVRAIKSCCQHFGLEHPRVEKLQIEELDRRMQDREHAQSRTPAATVSSKQTAVMNGRVSTTCDGISHSSLESEEEKLASNWEADRQILDTLKRVGHRLTTPAMRSEMEKRYGDVSESTVKKRLATLVRRGKLTTVRKTKPSGYGLPEWNGSLGSCTEPMN